MNILEQKIKKYEEFISAINLFKNKVFTIKSLMPPTMERELRMYSEFLNDLNEIKNET